MKVKCKKIYNVHTKKFVDKDYWLTIGKEYTVLEITSFTNKGMLYRLVGDNEDKMPALYEAFQFEITSNLISASWTVEIFNETITLTPKAWHAVDFWDNCYDRDEKALEIYRRESWVIFEEENLFP